MNQQESDGKVNLVQLEEQLKMADLDYRFAQMFTHSGGVFNYCVDEAEALKVLSQILKIEGVKSCFCYDEDLKNFLNVLNTPYTEALELFNDAAFITCEYLMARNGQIMLSANNIKHYHSSRLPARVIIMGSVSQIVTDLNTAMAKAKRRGNLKNLTSVSGRLSKLETMSGEENTKLFLLLLED